MTFDTNHVHDILKELVHVTETRSIRAAHSREFAPNETILASPFT